MSVHACDADFFLASTGIATCRVCGSQWQHVNIQKTETKQMSRDADRLRAVAEHIETNDLPGTSTIGVMRDPIYVLLFAYEGERIVPFLAWADSLGEVQLSGSAHEGRYHLHAIGNIANGTMPIDVGVVIAGSELDELINEFGYTGEDIFPSREQLAKIADQEMLGDREGAGQ